MPSIHVAQLPSQPNASSACVLLVRQQAQLGRYSGSGHQVIVVDSSIRRKSRPIVGVMDFCATDCNCLVPSNEVVGGSTKVTVVPAGVDHSLNLAKTLFWQRGPSSNEDLLAHRFTLSFQLALTFLFPVRSNQRPLTLFDTNHPEGLHLASDNRQSVATYFNSTPGTTVQSSIIELRALLPDISNLRLS